jgi:hypothetical protein
MPVNGWNIGHSGAEEHDIAAKAVMSMSQTGRPPPAPRTFATESLPISRRDQSQIQDLPEHAVLDCT